MNISRLTSWAVQIDSVTRSIRRTDRIQLESGQPDCSSRLAVGLHYQKLILAGRFRFSSPKTRIIQNISRLQPKFSDFGNSFPESSEKTQISVIFPLDPARF